MYKGMPFIRKKLKEMSPLLRSSYKAEIQGIFGSYVKNEAGKKSDLDILARFRKGASMFDLVGLSQYLEEELGITVDVVPEDALREEIRDHVMHEAVPL